MCDQSWLHPTRPSRGRSTRRHLLTANTSPSDSAPKSLGALDSSRDAGAPWWQINSAPGRHAGIAAAPGAESVCGGAAQ
ncbi:protein of unknown function [Microbacterium sp. Nx66]|nr:protein of unknown function [Microbacterium sp. Nx66]